MRIEREMGEDDDDFWLVNPDSPVTFRSEIMSVEVPCGVEAGFPVLLPLWESEKGFEMEFRTKETSTSRELADSFRLKVTGYAHPARFDVGYEILERLVKGTGEKLVVAYMRFAVHAVLSSICLFV